MWFGVILSPRSPWLGLVFVLAFWLYYERIMFAEEEFLRGKFGKEYVEWSNRTPAFLPNFSLWQPWSLPFSWRNVFKREYHGFLGLILAFALAEFIGDYIVYGHVVWDKVWLTIAAVSLFFYIVLRFLHKKTSFLNVPGR